MNQLVTSLPSDGRPVSSVHVVIAVAAAGWAAKQSMAGLHIRPAAALATGAVALLLLLVVTPADARKNAIMSPFTTEATRFGRNLLVS